jgi:diguanylate cyclase (GGDEF)-like protein
VAATESESLNSGVSLRHLLVWFIAYLAAAAADFVTESLIMAPGPLSLAAGVALAATLSAGPRVWPALFLGALLRMLFIGWETEVSVQVIAATAGAAGITFGAVTAGGIVQRMVEALPPVERVADLLVFFGFGAVLNGLIAGSVVTAGFSVVGLGDQLGGIWRVWFVSDFLGALVFTPAILAWQFREGAPYSGERREEAVMVTILVALLALVAFGPLAEFVGPVASHPLILALPLAWGALRFGSARATLWVVVVALLAIWGTGQGFGALNAVSVAHPLPALQFMVFVIAVTTLTLGAIATTQLRIEQALVEANRRLGERVDERTQALRESEERLGNLSTTDDLTGASNRAYFLEMSKMEFYRARRYQRELAVLMMDGDRFKNINDTHGHAAGDVVLRALTETCQEVLRASDIFGRIGGEEFAATLPDTDLVGALEVAERLRQAVEERQIEIENGTVSMTVSIGVAVISEQTTEYEQLLKQADDALYRAKEAGRNKVLD